MDGNHIISLVLDDSTLNTTDPTHRHDRDIAISDLLAENSFHPNGINSGPYHITLGFADNRLMIDIAPKPGRITIPILPLKRIIKDYMLICESYAKAVETADPRKIEAIDMGRRGLHNEGSELLQELLEGKVTIDFDTARRFFTLIFVLHLK